MAEKKYHAGQMKLAKEQHDAVKKINTEKYTSNCSNYIKDDIIDRRISQKTLECTSVYRKGFGYILGNKNDIPYYILSYLPFLTTDELKKLQYNLLEKQKNTDDYKNFLHVTEEIIADRSNRSNRSITKYPDGFLYITSDNVSYRYTYDNGVLNGTSTKFFRSEDRIHITNYKNNKKESTIDHKHDEFTYTVFNANKMYITTYNKKYNSYTFKVTTEKNIKDGSYIKFVDNKLEMIGNFKNDKRFGRFNIYSKGDIISSYSYDEHGKKDDGVCVIFDIEGSVNYLGTYKNDTKDGFEWNKNDSQVINIYPHSSIKKININNFRDCELVHNGKIIKCGRFNRDTIEIDGRKRENNFGFPNINIDNILKSYKNTIERCLQIANEQKELIVRKKSDKQQELLASKKPDKQTVNNGRDFPRLRSLGAIGPESRPFIFNKRTSHERLYNTNNTVQFDELFEQTHNIDDCNTNNDINMFKKYIKETYNEFYSNIKDIKYCKPLIETIHNTIKNTINNGQKKDICVDNFKKLLQLYGNIIFKENSKEKRENYKTVYDCICENYDNTHRPKLNMFDPDSPLSSA